MEGTGTRSLFLVAVLTDLPLRSKQKVHSNKFIRLI